MNWLLKKLGYRDRKYRARDVSVTVQPGFREIVSVIHERGGIRLHLDGERIGKKWEGISVHIPEELDPARVTQVARDLETAFQAMSYGYIIARVAGVEIVSETEQQAAMAELNSMGFDVEVSPDRKQIRQKWREGTPAPASTLRENKRRESCRWCKPSMENASASKSWPGQAILPTLANKLPKLTLLPPALPECQDSLFGGSPLLQQGELDFSPA